MKRRDPLTDQERSRQMALVKSKNTRPELAVRRMIWSMGFRYRLHATNVIGRPDIVLKKHRRIIFVHGCFWHRHKGCSRTRMPKTRVRFWKQKFQLNITRDKVVRKKLRQSGWKILVIWECMSENATNLNKTLRRFLGDLS
jgi:DNA mismatch endonuclease (patch repair protein)